MTRVARRVNLADKTPWKLLNVELELLFIQASGQQETCISGNLRASLGILGRTPSLRSCLKAVYTQRSSMNKDERSAYTVVSFVTP